MLSRNAVSLHLMRVWKFKCSTVEVFSNAIAIEVLNVEMKIVHESMKN